MITASEVKKRPRGNLRRPAASRAALKKDPFKKGDSAGLFFFKNPT
jgi:hypothetical protein